MFVLVARDRKRALNVRVQIHAHLLLAIRMRELFHRANDGGDALEPVGRALKCIRCIGENEVEVDALLGVADRGVGPDDRAIFLDERRDFVE